MKRKNVELLEPLEFLPKEEEKEIIAELKNVCEVEPEEALEEVQVVSNYPNPRELFLDTFVEVSEDGRLILNGQPYGLWENYAQLPKEVRTRLFTSRGFTIRG